MIKHQLSDTAFLVNESRARKSELSKDIYAHFWILSEQRKGVKKLWEAFAKEVYPYDDVEISVRNRYMLEHLQAFAEANKSPVHLNIGAGLTSYPFLLKHDHVLFIEIDLPYIIAYKKERLEQLQSDGYLPKKEVMFISADLNSVSDRETLKKQLIRLISNRPSFIQMEGLTYYLSISSLNNLLNIFHEIQQPGSVLVFDFWKPVMQEHSVFQKLQKFFAYRFGHQSSNYSLLEKTFITSIEGYTLIEITNVVEQEANFTNAISLRDAEYTLHENYALLKRNSE